MFHVVRNLTRFAFVLFSLSLKKAAVPEGIAEKEASKLIVAGGRGKTWPRGGRRQVDGSVVGGFGRGGGKADFVAPRSAFDAKRAAIDEQKTVFERVERGEIEGQEKFGSEKFEDMGEPGQRRAVVEHIHEQFFDKRGVHAPIFQLP